jgi:hypothetical protein
MEKGAGMTKEELEIIEINETILAARIKDKWTFDGGVSDLMRFVFSDEWADNVYSQYYIDFWEKVIIDLDKHKGKTAQIELDMVFEFGISTEDGVRKYMKDAKDNGPRLLVMHREEGYASMTCAILRGWQIADLSVSI